MAKITKKCVHCSTMFEYCTSRQPNRQYCSRKCFAEKRKTKVRRECMMCDKEFYVSPSQLSDNKGKFCSRQCAVDFHKKKEKSICIECGIDFEFYPKGGTGKFCSHKCYTNNKKTDVKRECKQCGVEFFRPKNRLGKFCSQKCVHDNQNQKLLMKCKYCENNFMMRRDHYLAGRRYCSIKCYKTDIGHQKVERKCEICGTVFMVKPNLIRRGYGKLCSARCRGTNSVIIQDGKRSSLEVIIEQELNDLDIMYEVQKVIGYWPVDFYIPAENLVIECDGEYWHSLPSQIKRDKNKDKWLQKNGYNIIRIPEKEIRKDPKHALCSRLPSFQLSLF